MATHYIERADSTMIAGWVRPSRNRKCETIDVFLNDQFLGNVSANLYRKDLVKVCSDGRCGFKLSLQFNEDKYFKFVPKASKLILRVKSTGEEISRIEVEGGSDSNLFTNEFGEPYALYQKSQGFFVPLGSRNEFWWKSIKESLRESYDLAAKTGYELHIAYGALLGHEREGTFIQHDDDIDMVLFCGEQNGCIEAARSFHERIIEIFGAGRIRFDTNGQAHVFFREYDRDVSIDFFAAWACDGKYYQNFTVSGQLAESDIFPGESVPFLGVEVLKPKEADKLLRTIYGSDFLTPNPSFKWSRPAEIVSYFAPLHNYKVTANKEYWDQYYVGRSMEKIEPPSQFAAFMTGFIPENALVVEFGCGTARDSFFFARYGWRVAASDYSDEALKINAERAHSQNINNVTFSQCNVADVSSLSMFLEQVRAQAQVQEPIVFYSRFFLHAISNEAEATLNEAIKSVAKPGDIVGFETRVAGDEDRPKVTPKHFRRFVTSQQEKDKWTSQQWEELYSITGTGFAKYKSDDAYVLRLVVKCVE